MSPTGASFGDSSPTHPTVLNTSKFLRTVAKAGQVILLRPAPPLWYPSPAGDAVLLVSPKAHSSSYYCCGICSATALLTGTTQKPTLSPQANSQLTKSLLFPLTSNTPPPTCLQSKDQIPWLGMQGPLGPDHPLEHSVSSTPVAFESQAWA